MSRRHHHARAAARPGHQIPRWILPALVASFTLLLSATVRAAATQEEVFRSLHNNITQTPQSGKLLAVFIGAVAVAGILIFVSTRAKREAAPKALNHQGKLLKEVQKSVPLSSTAVKSLKKLAEEQERISPLTLLLCPSLRQRSAANKPAPAKTGA
jgi:hypothetical protein